PHTRHGGADKGSTVYDRRRGLARSRESPTRSHVGAPAHVPVCRPLRPAPVEGEVTPSGAAGRAGDGGGGAKPGKLFVVSTPIDNWGVFPSRGGEPPSTLPQTRGEHPRHTRHLLER